MKKILLPLALLAASAVPAQAYTVQHSDTYLGNGVHQVDFNVTAGAKDEQFADTIFYYHQTVVTPIDNPFAGIPSGCWSFYARGRYGPPVFRGTNCGWWIIPAGTTRDIRVNVVTGSANGPSWGTY